MQDALGARSAPALAPRDVFDIGATDANMAQLMIRELRPFAHRLSFPEPSADLLRDHFERDHFDSFSGSPGRLLGGNPFVPVSQGGAACSARSPQKLARGGLHCPCSRTHRRRERPSPSHFHGRYRRKAHPDRGPSSSALRSRACHSPSMRVSVALGCQLNRWGHEFRTHRVRDRF